MTKKVLISTGGSGGHVIPAITIYNHLKNNYEILLSTDERGVAYLDKNYNSVIINTPKLNNFFLFPFSLIKILFLTFRSFFIFKKKNISILISTGGSGGHVIPAITIYDHLKLSYETLISTDLRGFRYLNKNNYNYIIVNTPKLNNLFLLPFSLLKVFFLTIKSLIILKKKKYFNFNFYWWLYVSTIMSSSKSIKYQNLFS